MITRKSAIIAAGTLALAACGASGAVPLLGGSKGAGKIIDTSQGGLMITTDLGAGTMRLIGHELDQSVQIPRALQQTGIIGAASYSMIDPNNFNLQLQKHKASISILTEDMRFTVDDLQSERALPAQGSHTMKAGRNAFECGWALGELALAAAGLRLTAAAIIGATEGIGTPAVIGLVTAHLASLASLVDVARQCL